MIRYRAPRLHPPAQQVLHHVGPAPQCVRQIGAARLRGPHAHPLTVPGALQRWVVLLAQLLRRRVDGIRIGGQRERVARLGSRHDV